MAGRTKTDLSLSKLRSAITNGKYLMHDVDHRGAHMRRLADLINGHVSDLGGADNISQAELVLIRRAAMLCLQCEMMERNWATSNDGVAGPKALMIYQTTSNSLHRILSGLGLKRVAKDVSPPTLRQYLEHKARPDNDEVRQ